MQRNKRIVNYTKNTLKVPAKEIVQSIQQIKQEKVIDTELKVSRSTTTWFTLELDGHVIRQQVLFIRALAARRLEVESKLGLLAIFNLD